MHSLPFRQQSGSRPPFPNGAIPRGPLGPKPHSDMTAGLVTRPRGPPSRGAPPNASFSSNAVSREWFKHSSAQRVNTDCVIVDAIRAEYPNLHLTVVPRDNCNLVSWANAGHATVTPIDDEKDRLRWRNYMPPSTRLHGPQGVLYEQIMFGKFMLSYEGKEYIMYVIDGKNATEYWPIQVNQYILTTHVESLNKMLVDAGVWLSELHDEIWVFDQGWWRKDAELYQSIIGASWDDVILDEKMKKSIISDVNSFFDNQDTYERLRVPWKRGIIYHGPPGNGKTISIKAMMSMLYQRKPAVPTLYVKTLTNFFGPEESINEIFALARRTAPCYLVFEDLDSIVSDQVRSFFLNAVDGIQKNDGILMVGSTNHLELLDPGISKRPSRFDRKYLFPNPNQEERTMYMQYWQHKLDGQDEVELPDKMCPAAAKITNGFSFAYLQEAMVASLLVIARDADEERESERTCLECMEAHGKPESGGTCNRECVKPFKGLYDWVWTVRQTDDEDPDLDDYVLWRVLKKQVRILREEMSNEKGSKK